MVPNQQRGRLKNAFLFCFFVLCVERFCSFLFVFGARNSPDSLVFNVTRPRIPTVLMPERREERERERERRKFAERTAETAVRIYPNWSLLNLCERLKRSGRRNGLEKLTFPCSSPDKPLAWLTEGVKPYPKGVWKSQPFFPVRINSLGGSWERDKSPQQIRS